MFGQFLDCQCSLFRCLLQIKKAAGDFKENVVSLVKDMNVETNDWHFNVESHEKGVVVDVAVKLLITKKK